MQYNTTYKPYQNVTQINSSTSLDKDAVRKQLIRALSPVSGIRYERQNWPKWLEDRLTTLAIYSYSNKNQCNQQHMEALQLFAKGWTYRAIGFHLKVQQETAKKYVRLAVNWVIENTPDYLLINIPVEHTIMRLNGCPHCTEMGVKGDLMWDDAEGEYFCLACARRYA